MPERGCDREDAEALRSSEFENSELSISAGWRGMGSDSLSLRGTWNARYGSVLIVARHTATAILVGRTATV